MNQLRKLAGQTAIYGLPSIIGRFINFLLVPLHTNVFDPGQFGIITEMYSYVAFLIVIINYGMETAFFRYASRYPDRKHDVFGTAIKSLFLSTALFIGSAIVWSGDIAILLRYPGNNEFVIWFAIIIGFDAISTIPLARLRLEGRAMRFAMVNLITIGVNVLLNLLFIALPAYWPDNSFSQFILSTEIGVGWVFIANLITSAVKLLLLSPLLLRKSGKFSLKLLKMMLGYGLPLILFGLAGIVNETIDRILLKYLLVDKIGLEDTMFQLGVYGACYKLAIILQLFIQAFRYAAEPFFFSQEKDRNAPAVYARIMQYFVAICCAVFLVVVLFLDVFKYFIPNSAFWEGLNVVPVLLFAYIFLGIYYNLSVWFKLSDQTGKGAIISVAGAVITIVLNIVLIPRIGYYGAAWATFFCYFSMVVISGLWGRKYYPVPYKTGRILLYLGTAAGIYLLTLLLPAMNDLIKYLVHGLLLLAFILLVWEREMKGKKFKFGR